MANAKDPQAVAEILGSFDDDTLINILIAVLDSRPDIALPLVEFAVPDLIFPPSKILLNNRAAGTIKSYNHEDNWGAIESPALKEVFGNDVFFHSRQNPLALGVGSRINFAVALMKENKPQAFDILAEDGGAQAAQPLALACGNSNGKGMPAAGMPAAVMPPAGMPAAGMPTAGMPALLPPVNPGLVPGLGGPPAPLDLAALDPTGGMKRPFDQAMGKDELGTYFGTIKSFNGSTGHGFISCPDLEAKGWKQDVFVNLHHGPAQRVGSQIMFTAFVNPKGSLQAKNVVPMGQ